MRYNGGEEPAPGGGAEMDEGRLREIAERDQLWASLRALLPEIERLAAGDFADPQRDRQIAQILARVTAAELRFRAERAEPE
jgi:hypothetical protein